MFSVDNPTLNRFYSLHYTLPFVLAGLSIFHIAALHQYGSTNPLGVNSQTSTIPFGTYFASKDLLGLLILLFVFACLVFFYPEVLGRIMAVLIGDSQDNDNAICWEGLNSDITRGIPPLLAWGPHGFFRKYLYLRYEYIIQFLQFHSENISLC